MDAWACDHFLGNVIANTASLSKRRTGWEPRWGGVERCVIHHTSSCSSRYKRKTNQLFYFLAEKETPKQPKHIKRGRLPSSLPWINLLHMLNCNNRFSRGVSPPSLPDLTPHYSVPRGPISPRVNHRSSSAHREIYGGCLQRNSGGQKRARSWTLLDYRLIGLEWLNISCFSLIAAI